MSKFKVGDQVRVPFGELASGKAVVEGVVRRGEGEVQQYRVSVCGGLLKCREDELEPWGEFDEQRADAIGQNGNDGEHYALTPPYQAKVDEIEATPPTTVTSDGSTASYYELPVGATELQHLISHRDMNAQIGEIFRACYRYGIASHSDRLRDARKIKFYIDAEIERLLKLGGAS